MRVKVGLILVLAGLAGFMWADGRVVPSDDLAASLPYAAAVRREASRSTPSDFPRFRVVRGPGVPDGRVFLNRTFGGASYALVVDMDGKVLWSARHDGHFTMDFKPHVLPDGEVRYSYFLSEEGWANEVAVLGSVVVLDERFRELRRLQLQPFRGAGVRPAENHDFVLLSDDHYLLTSCQESSWGSAQVMASVIQEVQDGRAVFEWRSTDHERLYRDSLEGNSFSPGEVSDYAHLSSLAVDPVDGHLLVGMRNLDAVLKVHRRSGEILWTLGGRSDDFGLSPDQRPSRLHHATRTPEGRILLFDNGNSSGRSRLVEFTLDEPGRRLVSFREVFGRTPASTFLGSAQYLGPGLYLAGWGGVEGDGLNLPDVSLIRDGEEIWTLDFLAPSTFSYRAFRG